MTLSALLRRFFLYSIIFSKLYLSLLPFVITASFDEVNTVTKTVPQNCMKTFWRPRICAKNGESPYNPDDEKYVGSKSVYRLERLNGVKVGHVREMNLTENKRHRVITRSLRPLLFEIPEFLTFQESNKMIQSTQKQHLENSETVYGRGEGSERAEFEKKMTGRNLTAEKGFLCRRLIDAFDSQSDGKVSLQEFIAFLDNEKQVHPTRRDALPIFNFLDLDSDGLVFLEECLKMNKGAYVEFHYLIEELKRDPRYFIRFSESANLPIQEPLVGVLHDRIGRLTGLSKTLIKKSEPIQVVRYSVFGHYNVHYDTTYGSASRKKCCRGNDYDDCHLCRFATIILYLNDVAEGGETAFPVADDPKKYNSRNYSVTLNKKCHEASLLIKPKKGKAVMWYNHLLEHDGANHMGKVDVFSLHGGCDVLEGVKWIANIWINAPVEPGGEI